MLEFLIELLFISLPFGIIMAIATITFAILGYTTLETDSELSMVFFIAAAIFLILTIICIALWIKKHDDE